MPAAFSLIRGCLMAVAIGALSAAALGEGFDDTLSRDAVLRDPEIPALGNPQGDLTVVEYFDYQCPYCKKVAPEIAQVVRDDGKIRLVLKDWPIFGAVSKSAAREPPRMIPTCGPFTPSGCAGPVIGSGRRPMAQRRSRP